MRTISGLFETIEQGKQAVTALESAGIASSNVSLVAPDGSEGRGEVQNGILVTATVDEEQADIAEAILGNAGSDDVAEQSAEHQRDGWTAYDPRVVLPGDRIADDPPDLPPLPR